MRARALSVSAVLAVAAAGAGCIDRRVVVDLNGVADGAALNATLYSAEDATRCEDVAFVANPPLSLLWASALEGELPAVPTAGRKLLIVEDRRSGEADARGCAEIDDVDARTEVAVALRPTTNLVRSTSEGLRLIPFDEEEQDGSALTDTSIEARLTLSLPNDEFTPRVRTSVVDATGSPTDDPCQDDDSCAEVVRDASTFRVTMAPRVTRGGPVRVSMVSENPRTDAPVVVEGFAAPSGAALTSVLPPSTVQGMPVLFNGKASVAVVQAIVAQGTDPTAEPLPTKFAVAVVSINGERTEWDVEATAGARILDVVQDQGRDALLALLDDRVFLLFADGEVLASSPDEPLSTVTTPPGALALAGTVPETSVPVGPCSAGPNALPVILPGPEGSVVVRIPQMGPRRIDLVGIVVPIRAAQSLCLKDVSDDEGGGIHRLVLMQQDGLSMPRLFDLGTEGVQGGSLPPPQLLPIVAQSFALGPDNTLLTSEMDGAAAILRVSRFNSALPELLEPTNIPPMRIPSIPVVVHVGAFFTADSADVVGIMDQSTSFDPTALSFFGIADVDAARLFGGARSAICSVSELCTRPVVTDLTCDGAVDILLANKQVVLTASFTANLVDAELFASCPP